MVHHKPAGFLQTKIDVEIMRTDAFVFHDFEKNASQCAHNSITSSSN